MKKLLLYKLCLLSMILCYPNINHTCYTDGDFSYPDDTDKEDFEQEGGPYTFQPYDPPSDDNQRSPQPEIVEKYKNHYPANFANLVLHVKQPKKFRLNKTDKNTLNKFSIDPTHPKLPALVMSIIQRK